MRNITRVLCWPPLVAIGIALGSPAGTILADPPAASASSVLTAEQTAALAALDLRLAALDSLAAKIDDPSYKAEVTRQIDDLKKSRLKLEKEFDQIAYEALMYSVISRYQVIGLWLKPPLLPPPREASRVWETTFTLAAPEANQAAAADERFLYAITNAKVAKYDRETGQLVATSTGDARHLNSGFFWRGKLYCAHSNYPLKPESSQIKVLDVGAMQLETFKDFGNYGGSLTWAVRESEFWWCNFARYGDDNAQTFLVKFDDQWREVARWTYPPELISQIGRMSVSGGIWRSGSLLVTDHDHSALYELSLPSQGSLLDYITRHPAPFTGQGIAMDPKTGGLVGINRPKRQIILAAEKPTPPPPKQILK